MSSMFVVSVFFYPLSHMRSYCLCDAWFCALCASSITFIDMQLNLYTWFSSTLVAANYAQNSAPIGLLAVPFLAAHPRSPANLMNKQKIKEFFRTTNVHVQHLSLQQFLTCLGLECYLDCLRRRVLEDLVTLSFEDMSERSIRLDHRVQMKNGIKYLMDLHNNPLSLLRHPMLRYNL